MPNYSVGPAIKMMIAVNAKLWLARTCLFVRNTYMCNYTEGKADVKYLVSTAILFLTLFLLS